MILSNWLAQSNAASVSQYRIDTQEWINTSGVEFGVFATIKDFETMLTLHSLRKEWSAFVTTRKYSSIAFVQMPDATQLVGKAGELQGTIEEPPRTPTWEALQDTFLAAENHSSPRPAHHPWPFGSRRVSHSKGEIQRTENYQANHGSCLTKVFNWNARIILDNLFGATCIGLDAPRILRGQNDPL